MCYALQEARSWERLATYYRAREDWPNLGKAERHLSYWLGIAATQATVA
jgi:hypothetical protein